MYGSMTVRTSEIIIPITHPATVRTVTADSVIKTAADGVRASSIRTGRTRTIRTTRTTGITKTGRTGTNRTGMASQVSRATEMHRLLT